MGKSFIDINAMEFIMKPMIAIPNVRIYEKQDIQL